MGANGDLVVVSGRPGAGGVSCVMAMAFLVTSWMWGSVRGGLEGIQLFCLPVLLSGKVLLYALMVTEMYQDEGEYRFNQWLRTRVRASFLTEWQQLQQAGNTWWRIMLPVVPVLHANTYIEFTCVSTEPSFNLESDSAKTNCARRPRTIQACITESVDENIGLAVHPATTQLLCYSCAHMWKGTIVAQSVLQWVDCNASLWCTGSSNQQEPSRNPSWVQIFESSANPIEMNCATYRRNSSQPFTIPINGLGHFTPTSALLRPI